MTIHGPGQPIYATHIQAEFGGGNPFYLSNYYAGGPYVPAGTTGSNGPVPSSGWIDFAHFYGTSKNIYSGSMVAGAAGNTVGYWWDAGIGSLNPDNLNGVGFRTLSWNTSSQIVMQMWADMGNGGWNNLIIDNVHNLARTSATYSLSGGASLWVWGGAGQVFNNGQTHSIIYR